MPRSDQWDRGAIGQRVKALRERKGLTGSELARIAKVDKSMVSRIEAGRVGASVATIHSLATALEVNVPHILEGVPMEAFTSSRTVPERMLDLVDLGEKPVREHFPNADSGDRAVLISAASSGYWEQGDVLHVTKSSKPVHKDLVMNARPDGELVLYILHVHVGADGTSMNYLSHVLGPTTTAPGEVYLGRVVTMHRDLTKHS